MPLPSEFELSSAGCSSTSTPSPTLLSQPGLDPAAVHAYTRLSQLQSAARAAAVAAFGAGKGVERAARAARTGVARLPAEHPLRKRERKTASAYVSRIKSQQYDVLLPRACRTAEMERDALRRRVTAVAGEQCVLQRAVAELRARVAEAWVDRHEGREGGSLDFNTGARTRSTTGDQDDKNDDEGVSPEMDQGMQAGLGNNTQYVRRAEAVVTGEAGTDAARLGVIDEPHTKMEAPEEQAILDAVFFKDRKPVDLTCAASQQARKHLAQKHTNGCRTVTASDLQSFVTAALPTTRSLSTGKLLSTRRPSQINDQTRREVCTSPVSVDSSSPTGLADQMLQATGSGTSVVCSAPGAVGHTLREDVGVGVNTQAANGTTCNEVHLGVSSSLERIDAALDLFGMAHLSPA